MALFKTCPTCGASLDYGETCTCKGKAAPAIRPPERSTVRPRPRRTDPRHEGARYELCKGCDLVWNVSKMLKTPEHGYLCPRCWSQQRNNAKE